MALSDGDGSAAPKKKPRTRTGSQKRRQADNKIRQRQQVADCRLQSRLQSRLQVGAAGQDGTPGAPGELQAEAAEGELVKVAVASETASPQTIQDLEESSLIFRCSSCAEEFPISINDGVRLSETWDCDLCGSGLVTFRCFRPATDRSDLRRRAPGGDPAPLPDDSDADAPEGRRMAPSDPASPRDDAPGGAGNERSEPQEPQEPADDSDDSGWGTEQEPGPARLAC